MALPPRRALFGVPSSAIRAPSIAAWSAASRPASAGGDLVVHVGDRAGARRGRRTRRRRRAGRPPRRCRSRRRPARSRGPTAPPASATSASTVGRPRESQTRRPCTFAIARWAMLSLSVAPEPLRPGARAPRASVRGGFAISGSAVAPDAVALGLVGDVFDRRLAVDAREEKARQEPRRAASSSAAAPRRPPPDRRPRARRRRQDRSAPPPGSTGISAAGG